jgi:RNA polymerase sigma-70 factor (ECF subfamily)
MDLTKSGTLTEVEGAENTASEAPAESPEVTRLVELAKAGDPEAFAALMRLYERRVIGLGIQMGLNQDDAMDACQDAFVKVFRYIGRFQSGRAFFKWLYRIAIHSIYDQMRRTRGEPVVSMEELEPSQMGQVKSDEPGPLEQVESARMAALVRKSLDCLSRKERIVFVLRDLQQLDTAEIGTILRISQITIRRHSMSARHKLRERIFGPRD